MRQLFLAALPTFSANHGDSSYPQNPKKRFLHEHKDLLPSRHLRPVQRSHELSSQEKLRARSDRSKALAKWSDAAAEIEEQTMKQASLTHPPGTRGFILAIAMIALLTPWSAKAQVVYQSLEDVYTQNFDSLPSTGTSYTWSDNSTIAGWYAANTGSVSFNPAGVTTGATTNGNLYSFGSSGASDRALGSIGSGSNNAGGFYYGAKFVNDTGLTINAITISYVGEQWRNSAAAAQTVSFQYSLTATGIKSGAYTSISALDFTSTLTGGTSGAVNGNSTAARRMIGPITITDVYWPPGTTLWLRWSDPDHTGFDHGLAIDDFTFRAAGASAQYDPPAGYYGSAQGLLGHDLEIALHNIISPHTIIPDTSSTTTDLWGAIRVLDEDPLDVTKVKLFYSTSSALKLDGGVTWNRDHLWPKSRGIDDSGPDSTDLFNIRAANPAVSSARGNKIFDNSDPLDANYHMPAHANAAPDTSTDTNSWQPPADERGDVARALFYMHVRYDGNPLLDLNTTDLTLNDAVIDTSNMGVLSTLLQWHRADPVSDEERRRNQLIYSQFQHNRNPFIDNPDFAESLFNELERSLDDQDLDGMPTSWEQANQFNPANPADASQDSDGDGFTNFEEYWMGSDPHNAASPTVITVDASYTGTVENGSAANPFKRIQPAIDAVPAAELRAIVVKAGVYNERPYANGKTRIHLFGQAGATATIIDGQQLNSSVVRLYNFDKATFSGFTVRNALTDWTGAGLRVEAPSGAILIDSNILTNNITTAPSATAGGGGLYLKTARGSRVINNFITNNRAGRGGGVLFAAGDAEFWHNTVAGNQATGGLGGGLSALTGVKPNLRNNIVWSNTGTGSDAQIHQLTGANNIIQDAATGSGNFALDPKFIAPAQNDYHVAIDSPARNNAVPVPVPVDFDFDGRPETAKARADIGADEVAVVDGDGNGVPDYWELEHYAGALGHGSDDFDNDGLTNTTEFQIGTDPEVSDSDGDGLSDGYEVQHGTNPLNSDTDADGMPDGWEVANGFNPLAADGSPDADNDGLTNLQEYQHGTNPRNSDTDADGMPDGWETSYGLNPLQNDSVADPDHDGFSNLQEYRQGTDPSHADIDTDGDGRPDIIDPWPSDYYDTHLPTLVTIRGSNQMLIAGAVLAEPIVVKATDANGRLLENAPLRLIASPAGATFSIAPAGPFSPDLMVRTGVDGTVTVYVLSPAIPRSCSITITATSGTNSSNLAIPQNSASIAAGEYHTLAVGSSGSVWAWGLNTSGQLGDHTIIERTRPTPVVGLRGVIAVSSGAYHSLALRGDGTVAAWGHNSLGQLGNGSFADSSAYLPIAFPLNADNSPVRIVAVAAGSYHNLALADDGKIYAWGLNSDGQLGDGTTVTRNQPVLVSGTVGNGIRAIAAGAYHSVALTSNGSVLGWGANFYGALGSVNPEQPRFFTPTPVPMGTNVGIVGIAAGAYHTMAIADGGSAVALGWNGYGELGDGSTTTRSNPAFVGQVAGVTYLAASRAVSGHCLGLISNGSVWSWGGGTFGQLGNLPKQDQLLALPVSNLPHSGKVAAGGFHSVSVSSDGSVYVWGDNTFGQLGNGSEYEADEPTTIPDFHLIPTISDIDQDNLPDWWERRYFGGLDESGDGDPDGDGRVNLLEYQSSKNPTVSDNPQISPLSSSSQLVQISTRASVGAGDNAMIAGFIIQGTGSKKVIVRAIGPSLAAANVTGALQDTTLELHDASGGAALAFNDNWRDTQQQEIIATTVPPTDDRESAIVRTLSPGAYTAIVRGKDNGTGVALIEVYDLTTGGSSYFANISTRALVRTGDNVMIAGFIITGSSSVDVVLRGIGPSLTSRGIAGALLDPVIKLVSSDGMTSLAQNDDWKVALNPNGSPNTQAPSQEGTVRSTALPPEHDRESAIVTTLPPGMYTAIISGKNDTTGVALVEVYDITARSNGLPGTTFTFTLDSSYATSAGVYTADDRLIRTLWRNVTYGPGRTTRSWDGIDDNGMPVDPHGTYKFKVLSHNVQYVWDGLIGNTSTSLIGPSHHAGQGFIQSLAIDGPNAFYALGYQEGFPLVRRFKTESPQTTTPVVDSDGHVAFDLVATDGIRVYYSSRGSPNDEPNHRAFVAAKYVSTNAAAAFDTGQNIDDKWFTDGQPFYPGCIDVIDGPYPNPNGATGLAVQKIGNILAVGHGPPLNEIRLFHKTSGAFLKSISVTNPKGLAMTAGVLTDQPEELWVLTETAGGLPLVKHYKDLATTPTLAGTISGLAKPAAITPSLTDRGGVIIADGGADQRLKFYGPNVNAQNEHTEYRVPYPETAGGYTTRGPEVTHDKFQFEVGSRKNPEIRTALAQMPDSSIWVGDGATNRLMRLDVSRGLLVDQIMFLTHNLGAVADPNTPTRVIGDGWLEFQVDYTKSLQESGSWSLKKNWAAGVDSKYFVEGISEGIHEITTLSNGRVYGTITEFRPIPAPQRKIVVELPASGGLRICKNGLEDLILDNERTADAYGLDVRQPASFERDGSQRFLRVANGRVTWYQKDLDPFEPFDASGNPRWGAERILGSAPYRNEDPVVLSESSLRQMRHPITSSNILITFDDTFRLSRLSDPNDPNSPLVAPGEKLPGPPINAQFWKHLGGIKLTGNELTSNDWSWRSSPTVLANVPLDGLGSFDIGDHVNIAGSLVMTQGQNVIYGYPGENWQSTEAGQWMHFYDDGLFIGQFGTPGTSRNRFGQALPGFTGNSFYPTLVGVDSRPLSVSNNSNKFAQNGETYLWADDKSLHSGVARWHVLGANAIQEQAGSVALGAGPVILSPVTPPVPAPPSGLTAIPGDRQVTLSWIPINGVASYDVKFSTNSGGPYTEVTTGSTSPAIIDRFTNGDRLINGTAYYFVVSAAGSAVNSNQVTAFPFATVGIAGQFTGGSSDNLQVSSTAPLSGNPALVGLPSVLGKLARTDVGRNGYVIYNWPDGGTAPTPAPFKTESNLPGPINVSVGAGSQWINDWQYVQNKFAIDGKTGTNSAIDLPKNSSGSINISASDGQTHYVTVVSPALGARQRAFTIKITPAGQGSPVAFYTVDDPENFGDNHVFQFVFKGNITLSINNGDVPTDNGGACLQALFFD